MVNVVTVAAYRPIYWLKLIGLVQRLAATWCSCYIQSNEPVTAHNGCAMMTAPMHHKNWY